jgi:hypothetical protein
MMGVALFGSFGIATTASAAEVIVTQPSPLYVNPGPGEINDSPVPDTWLRENFRAGTGIGITTTYARSGNGSLEFTGTNGASKADLEYYFSGVHTLSDLTSLGYDWYRASTSTNPAAQVPSLRLLVGDTSGNAIGYLVYEPIYNGYSSPLPTDQWETSTFDPSTSILWWSQFGKGIDENYTRTLNDWIAGDHTAGFDTLSGDNRILGLSTGVGSGWNGVYDMAVDNVMVGFNSQPSTTFNFEVQSVPEPSSFAMLSIAGLSALAVSRIRRRRSA